MTIILVSLYYQKNIHSGANKRFDETGRFLKQTGADLKIVVKSGEVPDWCNNTMVVEVETTLSEHFWRIESFFRLTLFLRRQPASIVISDFMPVPARALKKHVHLQLVHDLRNFTEFHRAKYPELTQRWQSRQWNKSKNILTVSSYTQRQLFKHCGIADDKVIVSHNGIDKGYLQKSLLNERTVDFLYVAHFEARKNHIELIHALSRLKSMGIESKTLLIGKDHGTLGKVEEMIAGYGLSENIEIADGSLTEQQLIDTYLRSQVFVSPARYEGFGMPIIEAMASGCVVACSDIEVFHEVAKDHALYFNPEDNKDIAEKMAAALNLDADRDSLREIIAENFKWEITLQPIVKEITKLSAKAT